jgi:hypothetical protein
VDKWVAARGFQTRGYDLLIGVLGQKKGPTGLLGDCGRERHHVSGQWAHGVGADDVGWAAAVVSNKGEAGREVWCPFAV